jgi:hypothetical protein
MLLEWRPKVSRGGEGAVTCLPCRSEQACVPGAVVTSGTACHCAKEERVCNAHLQAVHCQVVVPEGFERLGVV